ncbi:MAG TPA: DUF3833 domain-containing protein [Spirochaetota bacterium]|mgnify:FL=1|nr:DUF3833 domain-containing protein [Spirochaetota bacterium]
MKINVFKIRKVFFNNSRKPVIALSLMMLILQAGCSSVSIDDYKDEKPQLILEDYLNGTFDAYGIFINRSGQVTRRMHVVMKASWTGDTGILDEDFIWSDGEKQKRIWHLKKISTSAYEGRAEDVIGTATGEVAGNAFHWEYTLAVNVDGSIYNFAFDDWMYLMNDQILINRAKMSKFGFRVGEINIVFIKRK